MLKQSQCECDGAAAVSYRYTLTVKSPAGTAGASGHVDLTNDANWTTEGTIKANFVSRSGREFINADRVQAEHTHTIETPSNNFSRGILPKWKLVFGTRTFQILSAVDVDEMRRVVRIEAKEAK